MVCRWIHCHHLDTHKKGIGCNRRAADPLITPLLPHIIAAWAFAWYKSAKHLKRQYRSMRRLRGVAPPPKAHNYVGLMVIVPDEDSCCQSSKLVSFSLITMEGLEARNALVSLARVSSCSSARSTLSQVLSRGNRQPENSARPSVLMGAKATSRPNRECPGVGFVRQRVFCLDALNQWYRLRAIPRGSLGKINLTGIPWESTARCSLVFSPL